MNEKNTEDLKEVLCRTHLNEFKKYCEDNKESMDSQKNTFPVYIKELLYKKDLTQQRVFLDGDIPERYGYKLLSGEKRTRQRDVILRICYATGLTLEETQRALKKYGMPELYAKVKRDAMLMIIFNEHPGSVYDVNSILEENGMEPLKKTGLQE